MIQLDNENISNDILEDFINEKKQTKFKINPIGVFFVVGSICIVWKFIDIVLFLIPKI